MKRIALILLFAVTALMFSVVSTAVIGVSSASSEYDQLKADISVLRGLSEKEFREFMIENQKWIEELNVRIEAYIEDIPASQKDAVLLDLADVDPNLRAMSDYFDFHEYHYRGGFWTYSMQPTWYTRGLRPFAQAGWNELVSYYGIGSTYYNSLYDQYMCHFDLWVEAGWDIEEGKPDISYPATLLALCNPNSDEYID